MVHQARVESRGQLGDIREAPANELRPRLGDECPHSGMTRRVVCPLHEDEASLSEGSGAIELALGGGDACRIFTAVLVAEQPDVDATALDLGEVHVVSTAISRRQVLEQKHVEEASKQRVTANEVADGPSFGGELLLDAADEDSLDHFVAVGAPMISCSNPSVSFSSARISALISSSVRSGCGL